MGLAVAELGLISGVGFNIGYPGGLNINPEGPGLISGWGGGGGKIERWRLYIYIYIYKIYIYIHTHHQIAIPSSNMLKHALKRQLCPM
jgi:hypothetical protein